MMKYYIHYLTLIKDINFSNKSNKELSKLLKSAINTEFYLNDLTMKFNKKY